MALHVDMSLWEWSLKEETPVVLPLPADRRGFTTAAAARAVAWLRAQGPAWSAGVEVAEDGRRWVWLALEGDDGEDLQGGLEAVPEGFAVVGPCCAPVAVVARLEDALRAAVGSLEGVAQAAREEGVANDP